MRQSQLSRKTRETQIDISLNLDGSGICSIDSGVGFLDHMLELFAVHGMFDLNVVCKGDTHVDFHHTVEDIGIVLGKLILTVLQDKKGIARYNTMHVPMDECLARTVLDISGRPYLVFNAQLNGFVGDFDGQLVEEFFRAVVSNAMVTCHINILQSGNLHHMIEAIFKSFARSLHGASRIIGDQIPSSKGVL